MHHLYSFIHLDLCVLHDGDIPYQTYTPSVETKVARTQG